MAHSDLERSQSTEVSLESDGDKQLALTKVADTQHWLRMYEHMLKIRIFEEQVNELYTSARMPGLAHLYIGEEAIAVGVCEALRKDDYITSTHRGHGHCLAKGASVDKMFAELLGKEAGYCHGKGGSMHIADQDTGNLGANAIVGGSAGIATGAAMSSKMRGSDQVAVCFFGDGALGQGLLYEVMNMASLWKFPVIYVCEDNLYNEYTHNSETTAGEISTRPRAFGIYTEEVDGQDVRAVYASTVRMVERARKGEGPAFLLCKTYRYRGHHVGDISRTYYRSKEEEEHWMANRDPLQLLSSWLLEQQGDDNQDDGKQGDGKHRPSPQIPTGGSLVTPATFEGIEQRVRAEVEEGREFALKAPFPEPKEVQMHVYA